jgi:hypothetical protein
VPSNSHVREMLAAAERLLSELYDTAIRLVCGDLYTTGKSLVARFHLINPPSHLPLSVIAKRPLPSAQAPDYFKAAFANEHAALEFLNTLADTTLAPHFYAGDERTGLILLEDLGTDEASSTQALLSGSDPARAEAALIEHASLIGRLHALTLNRHAEYIRVRSRLNPPPATTELFSYPWPSARLKKSAATEIERTVRVYHAAFEYLGIRPHAGVAEEIASVAAAVEENPDTFLAFCQGDQNGPGGSIKSEGRLRLYDFDCASYRHALLEGVPARTTWGCFMRLPTRLEQPMERAYREELVVACAEAADDHFFHRALTQAAARWHIFQVLDRLTDCLTQDAPRGPTSRRQQYLAWMDAFIRLTEEYAHMQALGASARELASRLRMLWPVEAHTLPTYLAFRREIQ